MRALVSLPNPLLSYRMSESLVDETAALLDSNKISYVKKPNRFRMTVDKEMIEKCKEVLRSIAVLVKKNLVD
jgi:hypothetical protein